MRSGKRRCEIPYLLGAMWNGKRYHSFDFDCRERFGKKLYKLSLNAGFTCPNRDGTLGTRGCIFCSAGGSGDFAASSKLTITEQIGQARQLVAGIHQYLRPSSRAGACIF